MIFNNFYAKLIERFHNSWPKSKNGLVEKCQISSLYDYIDELRLNRIASESTLSVAKDSNCINKNSNDYDTVGIVLINVGSPSSPTYFSTWSYLKSFLMDRRVIELPRWWWFFCLHICILPFRSAASANRYKSVWRGRYAPLVQITKRQSLNLQKSFDELYDNKEIRCKVVVLYGMFYGEPSVSEAIRLFQSYKVDKILFFPLFPQSSGAVIGASLDLISNEYKNHRNIPNFRFLSGFSDNKYYINGISNLIRRNVEIPQNNDQDVDSANPDSEQLQKHQNYLIDLHDQCFMYPDNRFPLNIYNSELINGNEKVDNLPINLKLAFDANTTKIIISFHGIPLKNILNGDKYREECERTYNNILKELQLNEKDCIMAYQSRFGYSEWLKPYLADILRDLASSAILNVIIICPGFISDCLETIHEICEEYQELFSEYTNHKGSIHYIECLNYSEEGIKVLKNIAVENLSGWI